MLRKPPSNRAVFSRSKKRLGSLTGMARPRRHPGLLPPNKMFKNPLQSIQNRCVTNRDIFQPGRCPAIVQAIWR